MAAARICTTCLLFLIVFMIFRSFSLVSSADVGTSDRNLFAIPRIKNKILDCKDAVARSQCLQNTKCRWCRSESIDDMCFTSAQAWRLPQQVVAVVMADAYEPSGNYVKSMEEGSTSLKSEPKSDCSCTSVAFMQKIIAEVLGTYFVIFAGCASVAVNLSMDKVVTLPGISICWGLAVMVMVYTLGHISGAHFNPSVSFAFATCGRFPWKQVPFFVAAQVVGSTLASGTLRILFGGDPSLFHGTGPAGSDLQSLLIEFIITFYLMFIVCGVGTDDRAVGHLAGVAVGATVTLNVLFAGPISGASMNPARSIGPAIIYSHYKGIWIYMVAPVLGATAGAWTYNLIRFTDKPLSEIAADTFYKKTRCPSK